MSLNKELIIKILMIRRLRRKLKRKRRSCAIRPILFNRIEMGESILVRKLRLDPEYHHRYLRMNPCNFDELYKMVGSLIQGRRSHSTPISSLEKLALTLRFLASGKSQKSLATCYQISPSAMSKLLRETMAAICDVLSDAYLPAPNEQTWITSEQRFAIKHNFPNCCGALDGKHIRIRSPSNSGCQNVKYKRFFSMVLLGIVDANYKFLAIDVGANSSQSDSGVFSRSSIGIGLENEALALPPDKPLNEDGQHVPFVIVGDGVFPLNKHLINPYPGKNLTAKRQNFNYRLSRVRMVVDNAFGILAVRWKILYTEIQGHPEFVKIIIRTCVLLHNFLLSKHDVNDISVDKHDRGKVVPGNWRITASQNPELRKITNQASHPCDVYNTELREVFKEYFSGAG